jgi:hypothetical protein
MECRRQYKVLSTEYKVLSTEYKVLSSEYSVLGYSVLGTQYFISSLVSPRTISYDRTAPCAG